MFARTTYLNGSPGPGDQARLGEKGMRAVVSLIGLLIFASVFAALLPRLQDLSKRRLVAIAGVIGFVCVVMILKNVKEPLLGVWVLSMTLFRPYSTFDGVFGLDGLYWVPSHAVLLALYGLWAVELVVLKRPLVRQSQAVWPLFLPFLIVAGISASQADNTGWAVAEIIRVSSVLPIFVYCRYNLGRKEWQSCIIALGVAILAQAALGMLQVTTRKTLPHDWVGTPRAQGTMAHPNVLADYLLLVFPAALALGLSPLRPLLRLPALFVAAAGGIGVIVTLSRAPWALMVLEIILVCTGLILLRAFSFKHFVGLCSVGTLAAIIAAIPFAHKLEERIKGDLKDSIQFRQELNTVARLVFENNPFVGVGLNNLSESIFQIARKYGYHDLILSHTDWAGEDEEETTVVRRVTVHNLYMYLLAETGLLGICALLLYLASGIFAGVRAVRITDGAVQALCLGLIVGITGALLHNFAEIALWLDPMLHTFALILCMLFAIPALVAQHGKDWLSEISLRDLMCRGHGLNRLPTGGC
jgi:putative inorganic carbon (hco3(-)) transporter